MLDRSGRSHRPALQLSDFVNAQRKPPPQYGSKDYTTPSFVVFDGDGKVNKSGDTIQDIPVFWCSVGNLNVGSCFVRAFVEPLLCPGSGPKVPNSCLNDLTRGTLSTWFKRDNKFKKCH